MAIIFLTGFMGSGKTTVGKMLAEQLQYELIDTDEAIEKQEHMSIKDIFSTHSEAYFRELETSMLARLTGEALVVTTGGGIVVKEENRRMMKEKGTVFFLQCSLDEILRRLTGDETRPLLNERSRDEVEQLLNGRLPYYREADYIVETTHLTVPEIVAEIVKLLKNE